MLPKLIVHADWSKDPYKRWICSAILDSNTYRVSAPVPVQKPESLVVTSLRQANDHGVILGFDFPIGVPKAYADLAGFNRFIDVLPEFGKGLWKDFYKVAERPEDVTVYRPFYPQRCIHRGQATQSHLLAGIGVSEIMNLLRRCELGNEDRNNACSLFWTLGGNQVGKAAITGWREILVPTINSIRSEVAIWPFDVQLDRLTEIKSAIIVETYPGDACVQLGIGAPGRGWSKRNRLGRVSRAPAIRQCAKEMEIDISQVESAISDGFGETVIGEDQFDAFVGLLGMLSVVLGVRDDGLPNDATVKSVEGWIFGQKTQ